MCISEFDTETKTPIILRCAHTFCKECVHQMKKKADENQQITCPECRAVTPVDDSTKANYKLVEILQNKNAFFGGLSKQKEN